MKIDKSRTMADAEYEYQTDASAGTPIRKGDYLPGGYQVETDAIRGGMGSVWRVSYREHHIAVKRPRQKYFTSPEQKLDFIRECDTWLDLGIHPNIVTCFRVDEIYGVPSIFSEWMDFSLKNAIADGTLYKGASKEQEKRLLDLAIQSAEGLCYAHAYGNEKGEPAGIIHQDIKPDNLLLTCDWQLKVADFGLSGAYAVLAAGVPASDAGALASGDATILSPAGGYTLAYCSAEQMDHRPLSRRTDIYSWAVSMMEMYIGSRPWETGVVAGLRCGEYMKHTRVRMAPRLKELVSRCMEKEADKRPHDFEELIDALQDIYLQEFSESYFRTRPDILRSKSDSSRDAHEAEEVIPSLTLGGMDEIKAILEKKPDAFDVLVPLAGLPGGFGELAYRGDLVYYREAMRLWDLDRYLWHRGNVEFDYPVADYAVPSLRLLENMVETVLAHLRGGKRVAIFCADGYKQTPYIAACVLFQMGIEEPLEFLRERYDASIPDYRFSAQVDVFEHFRVRHIAQTYWGCKPQLKKLRVKNGISGASAHSDPDIEAAYWQIVKELGERARILVRYSGGAPLIWVLVEAPDEEQCERAMNAYIDALKKKGYFEGVVR